MIPKEYSADYSQAILRFNERAKHWKGGRELGGKTDVNDGFAQNSRSLSIIE